MGKAALKHDMEPEEEQQTEEAAIAQPQLEPETPPKVVISSDGLEAMLQLRATRRSVVLYEHVIELMDRAGIIYGVDPTAIRRELAAYSDVFGEKPNRDIRVARGTPPKPGVDGTVEVLIKPPPPVVIDQSGRADYRNIEKFRTVEPGQVLARVTPPVPGEPGIDVFGEQIPSPPPKEPELEAGPNVGFRSSSNEYVAQVHGIFVHNNQRIDVNPVLNIRGDVGLESGNVTYDGNVKIGNNIERGSIVSATGDVEVGGTIESGTVRCGGSLTVRKGINTRRDEMVTVNGDIYATYIDNSNVTANGTLIVSKSIIASHIICYSDINLSAKGSALTGGEITCYGSLSADSIGNRTGIPTRIYLGLHHKNLQYYKLHLKEMEEIEREYERMRDEVIKIKNYIQRMRGKIPVGKQASFQATYKDYKHQVELRDRIQAQIAEYRESRYDHEEVRLTIRDTIHPGVEIHYRSHVEKITAPQTRAVFRFIPGREKPVLEAYKG